MITVEEILKDFKGIELTPEQKQSIVKALGEEYSLGEEMKEHCPQCDHPLMYTWGFGPACLRLLCYEKSRETLKTNGGCGYVWNDSLGNWNLSK